ncbi:hypothetical protein VOLCADRAFT_119755 [Volvox carteri f. nagariensis]|uniref:Guanylate cyclase domain-containing protein n=1 Tax=Volvox carteri f. nagariensis TaxID=3068 RepID=D8UGA3_VOLCA|nr:uncharacterized protein VOLCADRAFT_119755 [Volvox carteri f. nagariensis]EFJ41253.1 hypothetical protein VOLCADRAFT_119755 [Volvox carteri f. nagariensis]|eukprot:XP_002957704.1 hypothetical protein VOLCADRAFT_119755 [Volvox carteri f. nagariensis]
MLSHLLPLICILVVVRASAAAADGNGQCMSDVIQELELQCNSSSPSYDRVLSTYRAQCCSRPLRVLAPTTLKSWVTQQAVQFERQISTPVNVTYVDPGSIPSTIDSQLTGWAQQDLWIVDGASIPFLNYKRALLPLEQKINDSPDVGDALLMYYRRDTLAALGRDVPTSWEGLLQLAADWNASTAAAAAVAGAAAEALPAPQYALCRWGPRTGWAVALDSSESYSEAAAVQLLNGSAMELALANLKAMAAAGAQELACGQPLLRFAAGECVVTLDLGRSFRVLQQQQPLQGNGSSEGGGGGGSQGSLVRGVVGVAPPPGSTRVLDRRTGKLVPAAADACRAPIPTSIHGSTSWACAAPILSYGGVFGAMGRRNGAVYQELGFQFLTWLTSYEAQWQGVRAAAGGDGAADASAVAAAAAVQPVRTSMLESDAAERLAAASGGAGTHMDAAVQSYLAGTPAAVAADGMLRAWLAEWSRLNVTVADVRQMLLQATPDLIAGSLAARGAGGKLKQVVGWAVAVGLSGVLVLLGVGGLAVWCFRMARGEARLRRIEPPGVGAQTTLVVTDIQDSTKLWEQLHSDVMDLAIYHHHSLARRLILRFRGYESATEELLLVSWPPELLELEGCRPVWMCKSEPDMMRRRDSQIGQQPLLEVTRSGAPLSMLALHGVPSVLRRSEPSGAGGDAAAGPLGLATAGGGGGGDPLGLPTGGGGGGRNERDASNVTLSVGVGSGGVGGGGASGGGGGGSVSGGGGSVSGGGAGAGGTSGAMSLGSYPSLGLAAPPTRYARSTSPYLMSMSGSGSPAMGALGASPRQLSFLGRSLSRLGPSPIPSVSTAATVHPLVSPLASFASGVGTLERHSTPRDSSGSNYRTITAAAGAVSQPGGQDILLNSPTSPVAYGGSTSSDGGGGGGAEAADVGTATPVAAAAARAGFSSGTVMSFRESFRDGGGRGGGGGGGGGSGEGGGGGTSSPSSQKQDSISGGDDGAADRRLPTLSGFPTVTEPGLSRSHSLLSQGGGGGGGSGGGTAFGGSARIPRPHPFINRSLSASGRSGDGDVTVGGAGGGGGGRGPSSRGRLSTAGCRSSSKWRNSADTFEGAPDRTTNNSRHSRSTEIATVSEFNVVLESGGQHFINPRSETDVVSAVSPPPPAGHHHHHQQLQQSSPWGPLFRFPPYGMAETPEVGMPPPTAVPVGAAAVTGVDAMEHSSRSDDNRAQDPPDGAVTAATGPLGEGARVVMTPSGPPPPYSPRAAVRRSSVTFDFQSTGTGSSGGVSDDRSSASGAASSTTRPVAAALAAATGTAAADSTPPTPMRDPRSNSSSYSSAQLADYVNTGSFEPCAPGPSPSVVRTSPNTSHPPPRPIIHTSRRPPSHLGPSAVGVAAAVPLPLPPLPPFSSRAASLRRRSDVTPSGAAAAAVGGAFPDCTSPYSTSYAAATTAAGLFGHGQGYDGALRPSPLGRDVSQSSISSGYSGFRRSVRRGSHGGGGGGAVSDATGPRSSNSRSLHGPSVDGDDITEAAAAELAAFCDQSSPLPQLFPAATISEDETATASGAAAAAAGVSVDPHFSNYTVPGRDGDGVDGGVDGGRSSNVKRSLMDFAPASGVTTHFKHQHQHQQHQHPIPANSGEPPVRQPLFGDLAGLGAATSISLSAPPPTPAATSALITLPTTPTTTSTAAAAAAASNGLPDLSATTSPASSVHPIPAHLHHHHHHTHTHTHAHPSGSPGEPHHHHNHGGGGGGSGGGSGFSRSLLALVTMPAPRGGGGGGGIAGGGGGGAHVVQSPESRAASMTSMMRLASQHNLQSVGESLCSRWKAVEEGVPGAQLVFRGLRVRMGMHSGLSETTDMAQLNRTANRMQYTGVGLSMAKAVADCAHGGQVLMSEAAFTQLAVESLRGGVMVLHLGEHRVKDDLPSISLYWGCPRGLQGRLPALRELAATALAMFRDHASLELIKYHGYLVEAVDGLVLASFSSPSSGLAWVAKCQSDMTMLPWPEELMCHEACEELVITRQNPTTGVHEDVVVFRTAAAVVSRRARTVLTRPEGPLEFDELPISDPVAALQHHVSINNAPSPAAAAAAAASAAVLARQISAASSAALCGGSVTAAGSSLADGAVGNGGGAVGGGSGGSGITLGRAPSRVMLGRMHSMSAALRKEESMTRRTLSRNVSMSQPQLQGSPATERMDLTPQGSVHAGALHTGAAAAAAASSSVISHSHSARHGFSGTGNGYVGVGLAAAAAAATAGSYFPPSLGSGTRTSRNSRNSGVEAGGDIDGGHSSTPRSSNTSNRSGPPLWAPRLMMPVPLPSRQTSGAISSQQQQQQQQQHPYGSGGAAVSPVPMRSRPGQGLVRHISAFLRSASLALQGGSSGNNSGAAAASAAAAAAAATTSAGGGGGPHSSSNQPMPPSPGPQGPRGAAGAEGGGADAAAAAAAAGLGLGLTSLVYRSYDTALRDSTSGAVDTRLLSTGTLGLSSAGAAATGSNVTTTTAGGGGGGGGGLLGSGVGGLRDRLPARLQAMGGLFRAGSFSCHVRRRADGSSRASDFGVTSATGVVPGGGGRGTRSPPESGRRYMSTASGLGYVAAASGSATGGGGVVPGSPGLSPALRPVAAAAMAGGGGGGGFGSGGFYWRREAHAAAAAAAATAAGSGGGSGGGSNRRRESRGEGVLLDRILTDRDNSFVIVVGEDEDGEVEGDSEGEVEDVAVSVRGGDVPPPPAAAAVTAAAPSAMILQSASGSDGGRAPTGGGGGGGGGGGERQPQRSSAAGVSLTAALMHLNSAPLADIFMEHMEHNCEQFRSP